MALSHWAIAPYVMQLIILRMIKMEDFKPLIWIYLAGLFVVFGVICLLRLIFRKNPSFLKYKLKIGGMILTLSAIITLGGCGDYSTTECYAVVYTHTEIVELDSIIYVNLSNTNRMRFRLESYPVINTLSYQLLDTDSNFIESNNIQALDGSFDRSTEEFHLYLPMSLTNNRYQLWFYKTGKDSQLLTDRIGTFTFRVSNF